MSATVVGGAACDVAPGTGANAGSSVVSCPVGTVTTGTPVRISVTGTVAASMIAPSLTNTASVTSTTPDPDSSDNSAASTMPVTASADLSLTKTAPTALFAGQQISWQLTAANAGPSDAQGVTVTDTVPAGVAGVRGTGPNGACSLVGARLTCPIGVVPAGGSGT